MPTINKIHNCPPLRFPDFNDDWKETTLGEIARNISSGKDKLSEKGNYHLYGSRGLLGHTETKSYTSNIILVARVGANAGEVIWVSEPCGVTDNALIIEQDNDSYLKANSRFIFMRLLSAELNKLSFGSGQPLITASMLKAYTLALPSLAEQKKIADFLSLIDERIQLSIEAIKELKTQKAALLNQLFSQKLRFPDFNDEWTQTTLGEVAEIKKGSGLSKEDLTESGQPVILYGELYTTYTKEVIDTIYSKTNVNSEKLVVTNGGEVIIPSSGETAWDIATARCVIPSNVILGGDLNIITLKKDNGAFFSYFLNGVRKRAIAEIAQGSSVVHLYGKDIIKLSVSLPSLAEQKKIADFLSLIDERIEVEEQLLKQYEKQRRYLLRKMFV